MTAPKPPKVSRALRLGVLEMAMMVLGMVFIRREVWQLHAMVFNVATWQEGLLIPLSFIDGAISGGLTSRARDVQNIPAYKGLLRWGTPLFFILYVGCAVLCERLNVGSFPSFINQPLRLLGLAIVIAGMGLRVAGQTSAPFAIEQKDELSKEVIVPTGPHKMLRHPDATGRLLSLLGLPLVFNAWMPILALPGVVILLKWHISDQEAFRISQLGEPYLEYRKNTWNLIPFVY